MISSSLQLQGWRFFPWQACIPCNLYPAFPEDNIRERVLSQEEFEKLLECLASPLREITLVAFYLGMRQKEILELSWNQIDLLKNLIRLKGEDTKTGFKRRIPLHPRIRAMLESLPRGIRTNRVFLNRGKLIRSFSGNYKSHGIKPYLNRHWEISLFTIFVTAQLTISGSLEMTISPSCQSPVTRRLRSSEDTMSSPMMNCRMWSGKTMKILVSI